MQRFVIVSSALAALALVGCAPKYPKCNNDGDCRKGEFCVNGKCQQCRGDQDCGAGKLCQAGACVAGCRTNESCPDGQACKNGQCTACAADSDCGAGGRCRNGRCLKPGQCTSDKDCPPNAECQNGTCVAPPGGAGARAGCTPEPVYFDFNESLLTVETTETLQRDAKCISSVRRLHLRLEGNCDPRGTEQYNMALGDRRAQSVKRYLERLGVEAGRLRPVSKGKLEAKGTDEATWAMDRNVKFIWE